MTATTTAPTATVAFTVPDLGEGLAEAEVVEWLVAVGDAVEADRPVVVVETAKAQVELPAPVTGRLASIAAEPGDTVAVGDELFTITAAGGGPVAAPEPPAPPEPPPTPATRRRVLASPSTRRLAVELGVDLAAVVGTGPAGRVEADDVRAAAGGTPARPPVAEVQEAPPDGEVRRLSPLRRAVAASMTAALRVPQITEFRQVDATALEAAVTQLRAAAAPGQAPPTRFGLLTRIVAAALARHPELNAWLDADADQAVVHRRRDIGVAVATPAGLIVPVLTGADRRSVSGIAAEVDRLATAARERTLTVAETSGATFTISNFGSYGTWLGTPIVNPPQVAIAGFGRIADAVVAVDGAPVVRRTLPLAVTADHRWVDGDVLGAFVTTLERLVGAPLLLVEEAA